MSWVRLSNWKSRLLLNSDKSPRLLEIYLQKLHHRNSPPSLTSHIHRRPFAFFIFIMHYSNLIISIKSLTLKDCSNQKDALIIGRWMNKYTEFLSHLLSQKRGICDRKKRERGAPLGWGPHLGEASRSGSKQFPLQRPHQGKHQLSAGAGGGVGRGTRF